MLSKLASRIRLDKIITKTDLSQWYLVIFFLRKKILTKTQYETHDSQLQAIVKVFKI